MPLLARGRAPVGRHARGGGHPVLRSAGDHTRDAAAYWVPAFAGTTSVCGAGVAAGQPAGGDTPQRLNTGSAVMSHFTELAMKQFLCASWCSSRALSSQLRIEVHP